MYNVGEVQRQRAIFSRCAAINDIIQNGRRKIGLIQRIEHDIQIHKKKEKKKQSEKEKEEMKRKTRNV